MDYLFIDESGLLGTKSDYFVIIGLLTKDNKSIDNIIKHIRRYKFKKQLNSISELKDPKDPKEIIEYLLRKLNEKDYKIIATVFNKKNIYKYDYDNNYQLLYDNIASEIAKKLEINDNLQVYVDRSKKPNEIVNFNKTFKNNIYNPNNYNINITHEDSMSLKGLQVADYVAWSIFQKYERNNPYFIDILNKKNIILTKI
ncbi:DUF3800 domain-containing protein [Methanobrevibacter sp. DSM 116169]|uniref:DUF3800 domain-containing protein n=1 Tax=Methanobrevibacter sp. DSM 116169 TaxID=3242727 RepID=UPI0038FD032C